eukprot:TRINITY_DN80267_c0_g1_i1.p1 TRINITY_DN80267_c0_g1~~TRINITY_DN80267_c0_g1_i1.p1  ORF type:complete len:274 (+),score=59.81 TRINITY_DN80267_c0_g1_i1:33-824(+)
MAPMLARRRSRIAVFASAILVGVIAARAIALAFSFPALNMAKSREELVTVCEQHLEDDEYEGLVENVNALAKVVDELSDKERRLCNKAYEGYMEPHKKKLKSSEEAEAKATARAAVQKCCGDLSGVVDGLLPKATSVESKVFLRKMQGDCHAFLALAAEKCGDDSAEEQRKANSAYDAAKEIAEQELSMTSLERLRLVKSISAFMFEVEGKQDEAQEFAKAALLLSHKDNALEGDQLEGEAYDKYAELLQEMEDQMAELYMFG